MTPTEQIKRILNTCKQAMTNENPDAGEHIDYAVRKTTEALALLETHVLVPKEPTEEMIKRGRARYEFFLKERFCVNTYKAMIGASNAMKQEMK